MKIYEYPEPILRKVAQPIAVVSQQHVELAAHMMILMKESKGIGLAAQQVGLLDRMIVIDTTEIDNKYGFKGALFNPKIIMTGGTKTPRVEGCLSFQNVSKMTCRPNMISVKYTDEENNEHTRIFVEMTAICIQHEIDHLNGILFIDYDANQEK